MNDAGRQCVWKSFSRASASGVATTLPFHKLTDTALESSRSLSGWTQDRGNNDGVSQIADGPEPLHDGVTGDGFANRGLSRDRS